MSAQGYEYWKGRISDNKEIERLEQQSKADENAKWRINQMLQSVMPSGLGRVIDWRRM